MRVGLLHHVAPMINLKGPVIDEGDELTGVNRAIQRHPQNSPLVLTQNLDYAFYGAAPYLGVEVVVLSNDHCTRPEPLRNFNYA